MTSERDAVAEALPGYEIGEMVGRGATGTVYVGRHRSLERRVAIKLLSGALAGDTEVHRRFVAEARTVASLNHPHIVPVFDFVDHGGLMLIVMEYLGGGTLATRAHAGAMETPDSVGTCLAVCAALEHAHVRRILHRDVKPDNVLFAEDGTPRLADFGIAKVLESDARMTATGTVIGTPAYMAPEVCRGEELGPPADVYSTGVMLYELLARQPPFPPRTTVAAVLVQHLNDPPLPILEVAPEVDSRLAAVVMRSLAKDPGERYESAAALGAALSEAADLVLGPGWAKGRPLHLTGLVDAGPRAAGDPGEPSQPVPPTSIASAEVAREERSPGRRVVLSGLLAALILAVIAAAWLIASRGPDDEEDSEAVAPTTAEGVGPSFAPLRNTVEEARAACAERGIPESKCTCVVEAMGDDLTVREMRSALDALARGQPPEVSVREYFVECGLL